MADFAFKSFTIGKDMSLQVELSNIVGANGGKSLLNVANIALLQDFDANPQHSRIDAKPISHGGKKLFRNQFEHWEGTFTLIRTGPTTDLLLQLLQDALLRSASGAVQAKLIQTVTDPMGGPGVQFLFEDAELSPAGGGKYDGSAVVTNAFSFTAPERRILEVTAATGSASAATASLAAFLAQLS